MSELRRRPAHALHAAVTHLDHAADAILRQRFDGLTYQRFLLLITVEREQPATQRAIAGQLLTSEPQVSRQLQALQGEGLVRIDRVNGTGNRRQVELTAAGTDLVERSSEVLEGAFTQVLAAAGIDHDEVLDVAGGILRVIAPQADAASPRGAEAAR